MLARCRPSRAADKLSTASGKRALLRAVMVGLISSTRCARVTRVLAEKETSVTHLENGEPLIDVGALGNDAERQALLAELLEEACGRAITRQQHKCRPSRSEMGPQARCKALRDVRRGP